MSARQQGDIRRLSGENSRNPCKMSYPEGESLRAIHAELKGRKRLDGDGLTHMMYRSSEQKRLHTDIRGSKNEQDTRRLSRFNTHKKRSMSPRRQKRSTSPYRQKRSVSPHRQLLKKRSMSPPVRQLTAIHEEIKSFSRLKDSDDQGVSPRMTRSSPHRQKLMKKRSVSPPPGQLTAIHEELKSFSRLECSGVSPMMTIASAQTKKKVHREMQGSWKRRDTLNASHRILSIKSPPKQLLDELRSRAQRNSLSMDQQPSPLSSSSRIPKRSALAKYKNQWASNRSFVSDDVSNSSLMRTRSSSVVSDSSFDESIDPENGMHENLRKGSASELKASRSQEGLMSLADLAGLLSNQVSEASEEFLRTPKSEKKVRDSSNSTDLTDTSSSRANIIELPESDSLDTYFAKLKD